MQDGTLSEGVGERKTFGKLLEGGECNMRNGDRYREDWMRKGLREKEKEKINRERERGGGVVAERGRETEKEERE